MKHLFVLAVMLSTALVVWASPVIPLKKGLIITSSVTIRRATYNLDADTSLQKPLIIIEGNNITVDFNDCTLQGSNDKKQPDAYYGLAVLIRKGSSNIRIINANIRGFKVAIMAEAVENLQIDVCDFSYNYRQHLHSNWKREDISDWMSYHHNENDEWLRYGAGVYLKNCSHAVIRNNVVTGGQCGLMMTRCDNIDVYNNNFSFNSGLGIGMYRSSNNRIYANLLNFNVRGFSDGIYYRGQDSGGILVFEQCNNNVFAYNSVTHSGDGFFLWAGQHTMDTGEGGCNDNLLYGNDFSYAPTNGVELTFSRNSIESNIIKECDHGIWGGYSYGTLIRNNRFENNRTAIAIEHGQHNIISFNSFNGDKTAIKLWSREQQPADWIYAQRRDTRSKQYVINNNDFKQVNTVFDIMGTDSVQLTVNSTADCNNILKLGKRMSNLSSSETGKGDPGDASSTNERLKGITQKRWPEVIERPGRKQIRMTEWGPYNFGYPLLFLKNVDSAGVYHLEVLMPSSHPEEHPGQWKLKELSGFTLLNNSNNQLSVKADSSVTMRIIRLEYTGPAFTDMKGLVHTANKPYSFQFEDFDPRLNWSVNFYRWDSLADPKSSYEAFIQSLRQPVYTTKVKAIDYVWWGAIGKQLPADSFATVAVSSVQLAKGNYTVGITADDLVKLYIDGKEIINAWDASNTILDENTHHEKTIRLNAGKHDFKIVHADIGGLASLQFYFRPADK